MAEFPPGRAQGQDFEVSMLRGQLAAVAAVMSEALGPAARGLSPEAVARRLAVQAAQAAQVIQLLRCILILYANLTRLPRHFV